MMKRLSTSGLMVMLSMFLSIVFSCKKESGFSENLPEAGISKKVKKAPVKRAYHDHFDTWYRIEPDNGSTPPTPFPAWFPGGGIGNAGHMGKASLYFNQYVTLGPNGLSSVAAPVTMFFGTELANFSVPPHVNSIVFDKQGNSIWFEASAPTTTTPVSPTRVNFTGPADIVGGTGKFSGATGQVTLKGYFNPQDPQDAGFEQEGWIQY